MATEIIYADLKHRGDGSSPAQKHQAPAPCPWWHRVLLKAGGLLNLILLVLVVVLSVWVFQGSPQPEATAAPQEDVGTPGRDPREQCVLSSLVGYLCQPQRGPPSAPWEASDGSSSSSSAWAGCKLCPQDWKLLGERCYWLSKEKGNWEQGKRGCQEQEAQLVVLRDKKEEENIREVAGPHPLWIGLRASHREWRWVDNTPLDVTMFGAQLEAKDGCGTLRDQGLEADVCDGEHSWVCQRDPLLLPPPPSPKTPTPWG
ncbi:killer cell lectin-like receptor subfamily G member 1 [Porphyrio hochstetteri]